MNITGPQLRKARLRAGLSVPRAARMVHLSNRAWYYLEGEPSRNRAAVELFLIKTKELRK